MSEYQYYEFVAIERPLTREEMAELRSRSSRAAITPTSFVNEYNWGDLKGNPADWMRRYFDAFVYVANWGTHRLMFRIPKSFLHVEAASAYCVEDALSVKTKKDQVVFEFTSDDESEAGWTEGEPWMPSLISLRADLMRGDIRALYLGWLASLRFRDAGDDPDDDALLEPPVPPGLAKLSGPLRALAEFLRIEDELIEAAAAGSQGEPPAAPSREEMGRWVKKLPAADKDAYLLRFLAEEGDLPLRAELSKRFREGTLPTGKSPAPDAERRTVGQLLAARDDIAQERARKAAEKAAKERVRKERERAEARAKHLDDLAGREPATWREVDALIATGQPKAYDQAVTLLVDLRDLAARTGRTTEAEARILELRRLHSKKPSLMKRFNNRDLGK
jgi:hypothetical protein